MGTLLCYINAFFLLLGSLGGTTLLGLFLVVGLGFGGYGIANEKKWGYGLAVTAALVQVAFWLLVVIYDGLGFNLVLNLMFDVALVALLLHPQSREYQRIWFK
jgi:hypothetical protein